MDRDSMLRAIDAIYAARCAGDLAAMAPHFAEGATFEFAGDAGLIQGFPATGAADALTAIGGLIDHIAMRDRTVLAALVDGSHAAVLNRVTVTFATNPPFETLLYDLFEFDQAGKVTSFLQFADTARVVSEIALLSAPA